MNLTTAASRLAVLSLLLGSTPASAQLPDVAGGTGKLFDGAAAAAFTAPAAEPPPVPAATDLAKGRRTAKPKGQRPSADLYYFTPEEADQAAQRFGIQEVRGSGGFVFDPDVPSDIQDQMNADLAFIGGIQGGGATGLHRQIFGSVDGAGYLDFFNSRVTAVGMNDCGNPNAVACVIPFEDPSKMWLTQNFIKFSHPQVSRMMVVFHEARHTETKHRNWPHAYCPDPFKDADGNDMKSIWTGALLANEPACDKTPLGSYGSSTIMLKNIQKFCKNCTDKVKMDAGLYADDQLNRITDAGAKRQMLDDLGR